MIAALPIDVSAWDDIRLAALPCGGRPADDPDGPALVPFRPSEP